MLIACRTQPHHKLRSYIPSHRLSATCFAVAFVLCLQPPCWAQNQDEGTSESQLQETSKAQERAETKKRSKPVKTGYTAKQGEGLDKKRVAPSSKP